MRSSLRATGVFRATIAAMVATCVVSAAETARADEEPTPALPAQPSTPAQPLPSAAAPPAEPTPAEVDESERPKKKKVGVTGRVHGGIGQRSLFDDSIVGADITGSLGLYINSVDLFFDVQLLFASNEGLPVRHTRAGPSVSFEAFSHVRLGLGVSLGGMSVTRATSGDTMTAFSVGGRIFTTVDVYQFDERTSLYLLGQLSVDSAGTFIGSDSRSRNVPATALWGPTLGAGVRF